MSTQQMTKLSPINKILYGSGDTGFSLTTTIIGAYFAIFLTDVVGLDPALAALAVFIGRSWDYVNDPIIGHISDRTRTRWGRRRPFLLFGWLPFALAFALLWLRPPFESEALLTTYYAAAYVIFDASATFVYMPYFALTPELTSDYDERTALTTYRMFFSILASLIAFTLPLTIIGAFRPANAPRVLWMGLIFGLISGLPLLLVFFSTREREAHVNQEQPSLRKSLRAALRNRPFMLSIGIHLATWVGIEIVQATLIFFIKDGIERSGQNDLIMATIFVTAIVALPLWQWIAKRWDKRLAYIVGVTFLALVLLVLITLTPSSSLGFLLTLCVLAGVGVSAAHVLPWSIIPDAIEWDEWQTGERHEGMFYSLVTLVKKITTSIAIPTALLVLKATNYVPTADQQPQSALWGIRALTGPIPGLLFCIGIIFALRYPLSRTRYAEICDEIKARRQKAASELPVSTP